jgi:hypothetical protein
MGCKINFDLTTKADISCCKSPANLEAVVFVGRVNMPRRDPHNLLPVFFPSSSITDKPDALITSFEYALPQHPRQFGLLPVQGLRMANLAAQQHLHTLCL